jgi:hypothetical protein
MEAQRIVAKFEQDTRDKQAMDVEDAAVKAQVVRDKEVADAAMEAIAAIARMEATATAAKDARKRLATELGQETKDKIVAELASAATPEAKKLARDISNAARRQTATVRREKEIAAVTAKKLAIDKAIRQEEETAVGRKLARDKDARVERNNAAADKIVRDDKEATAKLTREGSEAATKLAREEKEAADKIVRDTKEAAAKMTREDSEAAAKLTREDLEAAAKLTREEKELNAKLTREDLEAAARSTREEKELNAKLARNKRVRDDADAEVQSKIARDKLLADAATSARATDNNAGPTEAAIQNNTTGGAPVNIKPAGAADGATVNADLYDMSEFLPVSAIFAMLAVKPTFTTEAAQRKFLQKAGQKVSTWHWNKYAGASPTFQQGTMEIHLYQMKDIPEILPVLRALVRAETTQPVTAFFGRAKASQ